MIWPGNSLDLNMLEMCLPYLKRITRPCTLARKHGLNFSVPPQDYIQRISPTTSPFLEFNSELQLIQRTLRMMYGIIFQRMAMPFMHSYRSVINYNQPTLYQMQSMSLQLVGRGGTSTDQNMAPALNNSVCRRPLARPPKFISANQTNFCYHWCPPPWAPVPGLRYSTKQLVKFLTRRLMHTYIHTYIHLHRAQE